MKCRGIKVTAEDVREMIWSKESASYTHAWEEAREIMEKIPEWQALDKKLDELDIQTWDETWDERMAEVSPLEQSLKNTPEWKNYDKAFKVMKSFKWRKKMSDE